MRKQTKHWAIAFLAIAVLTTPACRRKPQVQQPEVVPPVTQTTAPEPPTTQVTPPADDFPPAAPDPNVLSEDIAEANRQAHERGFIRDAFFGFDESTLNDESRAALTQTATWLRAHSEYRIRVEGHCDSRGTEQYNLALGDRRAGAAAAFLETQGIEHSRIETVSYGEQRPFEEGTSEEAYAQNRRAHVTLSGRN